jgi:hypothetical protein
MLPIIGIYLIAKLFIAEFIFTRAQHNNFDEVLEGNDISIREKYSINKFVRILFINCLVLIVLGIASEFLKPFHQHLFSEFLKPFHQHLFFEANLLYLFFFLGIVIFDCVKIFSFLEVIEDFSKKQADDEKQ